MPQRIPALKMETFQGTYFNEVQETGKTAPDNKEIEIIRTAEHLSTCKSAAGIHLLEFYMVVLIKDGEGVYNFGSSEYYLGKNTLCLVSPWLMTSWSSQTSYQEGYCCTFSEKFFNEGQEDKLWLSNLAFNEASGNLVMKLSDAEMGYFAELMESMVLESERKNEHSPDILRIMLHLLLRKTRALFPINGNQIKSVNRTDMNLTNSFLKSCKEDVKLLIQGKLKFMPSLSDYASKLNVTNGHMNDTVKAVTGASAGYHLHELLAEEATVLLKQTAWTINDIAYQLGFLDPSYFARFYKKHTGTSPTDLRRQLPK
jgi:AraC family transcriptional regulator, transcriptional activator of pobA